MKNYANSAFRRTAGSGTKPANRPTEVSTVGRSRATGFSAAYLNMRSPGMAARFGIT